MGLRKNLRISGVDLKRLVRSPRMWAIYKANRNAFFLESEKSGLPFERGKDFPCLWDRLDKAGVAVGQYFFQDLLVARKIYERKPSVHVDIGSRVDGFVSHVAVFMKIRVLDIREVNSADPNIEFERCDIMIDDPDRWGSVSSLSCLHALEHFGLGRYGDSIDFEGHVAGLRNMVKMLKVGGIFYLSVPISSLQRIEFDAHRVFSIPYLVSLFERFELSIRDFHYVGDDGFLRQSASLEGGEAARTFGLSYGCGIFELQKS